MKIKQIKLCYQDECTNTFYSFETYINQILTTLSLEEGVSDIKIEHYSKDFIVIGYYKEVKE